MIKIIDDNLNSRGELSSSTVKDKLNGRPQVAPTISRIIQQFKGSITKQIGKSVWQKSFYDEVKKNDKHYNEVWEYIDENPLKWTLDKYY
ncbi:MAG: hypothetical protein R3Y35_02835 [Clostridia bacterium]